VNGFYDRKKKMLEQDIISLNQLTKTVNKQIEIAEQDLKLAEESLNMSDMLYNQKAISREELRNEKRKLLNKQSALPQLNAAGISNGYQLRDKQKEIFQLDHDIAQQKLIFEQMLETLKSNVAEWMQKYVLRSPVDGKIAFVVPLQENVFLQSGKLLGYVVPTQTTYYAELQLPQINFGKIDTGMHVQLRFNAYPYQEFGFIDSKITYISKVPSDSGFLATAAIGSKLVTNYNRPVQYKNGLRAEGIVITRNMRLFNRIYYNIVKMASAKKS
jgi:HlyD family secretion protein